MSLVQVSGPYMYTVKMQEGVVDQHLTHQQESMPRQRPKTNANSWFIRSNI